MRGAGMKLRGREKIEICLNHSLVQTSGKFGQWTMQSGGKTNLL